MIAVFFAFGGLFVGCIVGALWWSASVLFGGAQITEDLFLALVVGCIALSQPAWAAIILWGEFWP